MSRWVIAIALTWSAWAVQQPAVAHARSPLSSELAPAMCGEGAQTLLLEELADLALGRPLTSAPAVSGAPPLLPLKGEDRSTAALVAAHDDGPPAWCISPDDPRCAPRDQSSPLHGPRAQLPMQDVTAMRWPELAAESGNAKLRPLPLGAARAGVAQSLERPPRAL